MVEVSKNPQVSLPFLLLFLVVITETVLFENLTTYLRSDLHWLGWDYSWRLLELAIIFSFPQLRECVFSSFRRQKPSWELRGNFILQVAIIVFFLVAADYFITEVSSVHIPGLLPETKSFEFPKLTSDFLKLFDLTFGLLLVAFSEEFVFRSVLKSFIELATKNKIAVTIISSIFFALSHWSLGTESMVEALFTGALLMIVFLRMGTILPCVIAHYFINLHWFFSRYYPDLFSIM